jgi:dTDP-4-amino-4,6-dideoxygalactose transaminase
MVPTQLAEKKSFPFLDLKAQFSPIREEIMSAVTRVLESQHFILGPEVSAFEQEAASYLSCKCAVGCASGSDALMLALMALGIGQGDEVITVPFTFVATAGSIARLGATPVFVDIDADTYNIDPAALEAAITPKTKAIMPVHLFGLAADIDPILEVAQHQGLPVIEDAAQAIGAEYKGKKVGNFGVMSCFSFFPSKNLGGAGDGGLITTEDAQLAQRLKLLRTHGSRRKYEYEILGVNSRLDAIQAAILRVKLAHLDEWTEDRRRNAGRYRELMSQSGLDRRIGTPLEPAGYRHVYNQFTIRTKQRDDLREFLRNNGIPTEIYYPFPLHLQPAFAGLGYRPGSMPNSEAASVEALALPIFPELSSEQQEIVVSSISEFFER